MAIELMTLDQAAESIGITVRELRVAISNGKLAVYRLSARNLRVSREDLDHWIASTREIAGPPISYSAPKLERPALVALPKLKHVKIRLN